MEKRTVALLLARGYADGPFKGKCSSKYKASIEIHGIPMVEYVIQAVSKSKVERIFIVQSMAQRLKSIVSPSFKSEFICCDDPLNSYARSVFSGLNGIKSFYGVDACKSLNIMLIPCDIPLSTADNINSLINSSEKINHDVWVPLIDAARLRIRYPDRLFRAIYFDDFSADYVIQNIIFLNGSLLNNGKHDNQNGFDYSPNIMDPAYQSDISDLLDRICKYRHKALFLVNIIFEALRKLIVRGGWQKTLVNIYKYITGRLTTSGAADTLYRAIELKCGYLISQEAEISYDIDCPEHLIQVTKLIG